MKKTNKIGSWLLFGVALVIGTLMVERGPFLLPKDDVVSEWNWMGTFSPDSRQVAFYSIREVRNLEGTPHYKCIGQTVQLHWTSVETPDKVRTTELLRVGKVEWYAKNYVRLFFSPDSQFLAVTSFDKITVVDIITGQVMEFRFPGDKVTSFAWSSSREFGYSVDIRYDYRPEDEGEWLQELTMGAPRRRLTPEEEKSSRETWPLVRFNEYESFRGLDVSPDKKYKADVVKGKLQITSLRD